MATSPSILEQLAELTHDINNALAIIQGRASQLKEACEQGEVVGELPQKVAEKVLLSSARIGEAVKRLRELRSQLPTA